MRQAANSVATNKHMILTVFAALLVGAVVLLAFCGPQGANAQTANLPSQNVKTKEFYVTFKEGSQQIPIYVREENVPGGGRPVPVLLVHGSWGNSLTWDFP